MPRNPGTGVYEQPLPDVITATTIESAVYNGFVNDVETDLNAPRPVVAGGTGADNATTARDNLDAEVSGAQVTNYDTHVFENGSFYSNTGATSAPLSDRPWWGIAYGIDASNVFLEARNANTVYTRSKVFGVWGSWTDINVAADERYVNITGDTMTGNLAVAATANTGSYYFGTGGTNRLGYDGTNYTLVGGPLFVTSNVNSAVTATTGSYYFGTGGTNHLTYDGTNYILFGGPLFVYNNVVSVVSPSTGSYYFGTLGTKYLTFDGDDYILAGGPLWVTSNINSAVTATTGSYYFGNSGINHLTYDGTNYILFGGPLFVYSNVNSAVTANTGGYHFGTTGTKYLGYDGTNYTLVGGPLWVTSNINSVVTATTGSYYFGNSGTKYLGYDGTNYTLVGGPLGVTSTTASTSYTTGALTVAGGLGISGNFHGPAIGVGAAVGSYPGIGNTTTGVEIGGAGFASISIASGNAPFLVNRNNDGSLIDCRRSGVGVGSITVTSTATAFNTSSDARLKEDLKSFDAGNIIDDTRVYDFKWKDTSERAYGVIAQEAVGVYATPTFHDEENDRWFVDYSKYVPVILQELKALRARVVELESKLEGKPA